MTSAFLVVRTAKDLMDKFWVCTERQDAITVAEEVASYWEHKTFNECSPNERRDMVLDTKLSPEEGLHYNFTVQGYCSVRVYVVSVRGNGEVQQGLRVER